MTAGVTTGVVLAWPEEGAAPTDSVAGLPLALRTLLTLQKEGVERALIVCREEDGESIDALRRDGRVRIETERVSSLSDAGARAQGPVLLARHDAIVDPSIYRELRGETLGAARAVVAARGGERLGPMLVAKEALQGDSADDLARRLQETGTLRDLEVGDRFAFDVRTREGRRGATHALFEACRKPVDGMVSRNLNRHVSLFISRRIVELPITPNMVSALTFLIGVAGSAYATRGGYVPMLVGAVLFQWNSILDGVDGELARVRFQGSKLGEWIDTVSDDLTNVIFYAAVGWGAHRMSVPAWLPWLGAVAAGGGVLTSAMYYTELVRLGRGDFYALEWRQGPKGLVGSIYAMLHLLFKKDFFILLFVGFAVLGALPWALPVMALGTVVTTVGALGRTVRWALRPKAA
jgi:phosphatidylglycerophosphate synthase